MIMNIENVTVQEITAYLFRLARLYFAFFVINLIELIAYRLEGAQTGQDSLIWSVVDLLLYFLNVVMVFNVSRDPILPKATVSITCNAALLIFNIVYMIYQIVVLKSIWALVSILGILIQSTTLYILFKLRQKLLYPSDNPNVALINQEQVYQQPYAVAVAASAPPQIAQAKVIGPDKV